MRPWQVPFVFRKRWAEAAKRMIQPAKVAGLVLPLALGLLNRPAELGVFPEPALDRLGRDLYGPGGTAAGLAGAELLEKEHHHLRQTLAGASRAPFSERVGCQGAEIGGVHREIHPRLRFDAAGSLGLKKGLQGMEGHQASALDLSALLQGNRLHQTAVQQVIKFRF